MFKTVREDIRTVFRKDPAAKNVLEVFLCYPGLHALWIYRTANFFYRRREFTTARLISHIGRFITGIEIHPGARIGKRFFIDHGAGVVIGETTEIGDDCLLYQGVVLGGVSLEKEKRHPTLENNVVVGAGAVVLGPVTLGEGARIGAGAVVISDIPPHSTAVGIPARIGAGFTPEQIRTLEHNKLPDPVAEAVQFVIKELDALEARLKKLESTEGVSSRIDTILLEKKKEIEQEFKVLKDEIRGGTK